MTGRDCNECLPGYWGLSDDLEGCKRCDCDFGGAYNQTCDAITGQCACRPHMTGRTCRSTEPRIYIPSIDLTIEAENATGSDSNVGILF